MYAQVYSVSQNTILKCDILQRNALQYLHLPRFNLSQYLCPHRISFNDTCPDELPPRRSSTTVGNSQLKFLQDWASKLGPARIDSLSYFLCV